MYRKGGALETLLFFLEETFNPLHNRLPVICDCQSQTNLSNEPNNFPNRRSDFSLLGSLSAVTKLPKALLYFLHVKIKFTMATLPWFACKNNTFYSIKEGNPHLSEAASLIIFLIISRSVTVILVQLSPETVAFCVLSSGIQSISSMEIPYIGAIKVS